MKLLLVLLCSLLLTVASQAEPSGSSPFQVGSYMGQTHSVIYENGKLVDQRISSYSSSVTLENNLVSIKARFKSGTDTHENFTVFKFSDPSRFQILADENTALANGTCNTESTVVCSTSFSISPLTVNLTYEVMKDGSYRIYEILNRGSSQWHNVTVSYPSARPKLKDSYAHLVDRGPTGNAVARLMTSESHTFCSGSLIAPNVILSNRHCIEGNRGTIYAVLGQNDSEGDRAYVTRIVTPDMPRQIYNMTTPAGEYSELFIYNTTAAIANDLVLLILDHNITRVKPIKLLPPAKLNKLAIKWPLRVIGYPGDYAQYDSRGLPMPLSNLKTCHLVSATEEQRVLQTDCIAFPGNSGGPLVTTVGGVDYIIGSASTIIKEKTIAFFTSVIAPDVATWINSVVEIEHKKSMLQKQNDPTIWAFQ